MCFRLTREQTSNLARSTRYSKPYIRWNNYQVSSTFHHAFFKEYTYDTNTETPEMPQNRHTVKIPLTVPAHIGEQFRKDNLKILIYCGMYHQMSPFNPADVAFPNQIEVKVNDNDVKSNFKGLKNKPGSTKPADITGFVRKYQGQQNTVQITYALTTKRYAFVVYLVRCISADRLTERIKRHSVIRKQKVLEAMEKANADPDIAATSIRMSLKDPISTMRITLPVRSSHCMHNQCFDGAMFLQLQEQAPQWSCPICTKSIPFESLCVDEYFQEILNKTPKSTEKVDIEPNGEWRIIKDEDDPDEHNTSSKARASYDDDFEDLVEVEQPANKPVNGVKRESYQPSLPSPISGPSLSINTPPLSSREPSVAQSASSAQRSGSKRPQGAVIDLTLSDDDDDQPPRPAKRQHTNANRSQPSTSDAYNRVPSTPTHYQNSDYNSADTYHLPAPNSNNYRPSGSTKQLPQPQPRFNTQSMSPPVQHSTPTFGQPGFSASMQRPQMQQHNSGSSSYSNNGNVFSTNSPSFTIRPPPQPGQQQQQYQQQNTSYGVNQAQQSPAHGTFQGRGQGGLSLPPINAAAAPSGQGGYQGSWRDRDDYEYEYGGYPQSPG